VAISPAPVVESGQRAGEPALGRCPPHPREGIVIDVADKTCTCCGGLKHRIGEDVSERLDVIPAQLKVIVTRGLKYTCRPCAGEVPCAAARLLVRPEATLMRLPRCDNLPRPQLVAGPVYMLLQRPRASSGVLNPS
jgi:hypothetical protein